MRKSFFLSRVSELPALKRSLLLFVAARALLMPELGFADSVTVQNVEGQIDRFLNIRSHGGEDAISDNVVVTGNPLLEETTLVHRNLIAVSSASASLTTGPDIVSASGHLDASLSEQGNVMQSTFTDHHLENRVSFEFVVGAGGTEMVGSLTGEWNTFGTTPGFREVEWFLDGDRIAYLIASEEQETFESNETRVFARGTHQVEVRTHQDLTWSTNFPPLIAQGRSTSFDFDVTFTTPAVPPPIPAPVHFVWKGQVPASGATLTNPNVAPGETWRLAFSLEGDTPDSSPGGNAQFIDPSINPEITFSGGYRIPISTIPELSLEILNGTFQIFRVKTLSGGFQVAIGLPGFTLPDDLPPDGLYAPSTQNPLENFHLSNSDGEITYFTAGLTTTVSVSRLSVPSGSGYSLTALAVLVSVLGAIALRRRQRRGGVS